MDGHGTAGMLIQAEKIHYSKGEKIILENSIWQHDAQRPIVQLGEEEEKNFPIKWEDISDKQHI